MHVMVVLQIIRQQHYSDSVFAKVLDALQRSHRVCGYLRCKEKSPSTSENMLGIYESLASILLRCSISSGHGEGLPFKPSVEYRP